jgi:hypothetical protein
VTAGRVLDTAAILDFVTGKTMYGRALFRTAVLLQIPLVVPAASLQAVLQHAEPEDRPFLELLTESENVTVRSLDEPSAWAAGVMVADRVLAWVPIDLAQAVCVAHDLGWTLVTGEPGAVLALDPHVAFESLP